ncbi:MAG: Uma2 family endonuclease [Candidatus Methylumidiphilus sp.]
MNAVVMKKMTVEEYLAWEELQDTKHEFLNGMAYDVYAMAGARDAHVTVSLNIASLVKSHLRGTPCRTYISDMKLQVDAVGSYFYPDVFVTCDERDRANEKQKSHPKLIVEVLSPPTTGFERGEKFAIYRKIASLQEYAVVDASRRTVDLFRKDEGGHWVLWPSDGLDAMEFASIGLIASLADIFEDVESPASPVSTDETPAA